MSKNIKVTPWPPFKRSSTTITQRTAGDNLDLLAGSCHLNDDAYFLLGNTLAAPDAGIAWNTAQTVDALYLGLSATQNTMIIGEYADRAYDFAHGAQTHPALFIQSANQSATEFARLNASSLTFGLGIATVAGQYSVGRNADATNRMQFEIPTGASYEWSINDVAQLTLSPTGMALASPYSMVAYSFGVMPNGFLYFDNVDATGSGFYNGTSAGQMNFWLGSIHGRALIFSNGDIRGQDFDHALQPYATLYMQGPSSPETENRQYINWYNDGSNSYHLTGIGGHRFGFEAIQANAILTFTSAPVVWTDDGVRFTVNTGTLTGTTTAPGVNEFLLVNNDLSTTLNNLVVAWNLIAGTGVVAHKKGNTVVFESSATGTTANAYVTTETTDTDNVYLFQRQMAFTANPTTTSGIVFTIGTGTLTGVTGAPAANQFQLKPTLADTIQSLVNAYNALAVGVIAIIDGNSVYFDGGTTGVSIFTETTDTDGVYSFTATTMTGGREFSAFMDMQPSYQKLTKQGTATAAVTTYASQYLGLIGSAWNTTTGVANDHEFRFQTTTTSSATPTSSQLNISWWLGGVFQYNFLTLNSNGILNAYSKIQASNGVLQFGEFTFSTPGGSMTGGANWYSSGTTTRSLIFYNRSIVDGANTAFIADTYNAIATAGGKIFSFRTGEVEKSYIDYLGSFNAGAGTTLLPAYSFLGDPNTGIWNSGADTLDFSTAGTTRMSLNTTDLTFTSTNITGVVNVAASGKISTTLAAITLGNGVTTFVETSNVMRITGDAGGNTIATITGGVSGQLLTLIFMDALVIITDTAAQTADTVNLSAAFTSAAGTTLTLMYNGTKWFEIARSVN